MNPPAPAPPGPARLRVAVVQMNSHGSIADNLVRIEARIRQAARAGADAVLFPECATTGYGADFGRLRPSEVHAAVRCVGGFARDGGLHVLIGTPLPVGRRWGNALAVFNRSGDLVHTYLKCQLTEADRRWFVPGTGLSLFAIEGLPATAIICHERRYPELVRIPAMAGARLLFHPNAGMDALAVSKTKRGGRDGIVARAFENAIPYLFANTVGPQGGGRWSAGDSKIVSAEGRVLKLADHRRETLLVADLDLAGATGKYAQESLRHPRLLARHWPAILRELRREVAVTDRRFRRWYDTAPRPPRRSPA